MSEYMDVINLLKQQPLMCGITEEEFFILSRFIEEKQYQPGGVIIEEKEVSDDLYFIVEGEVQILKWDELHKIWKLIDKLKKGNMFGEMAFLDSSPRFTEVKATVDTTVLKLSKGQLDISSIYNKIVKNIAVINTNRLRTIIQKYVNNQGE